jgi:hypothetical protein
MPNGEVSQQVVDLHLAHGLGAVHAVQEDETPTSVVVRILRPPAVVADTAGVAHSTPGRLEWWAARLHRYRTSAQAHSGATTATQGLIREEGFWVFQEGSGGDGVFHTTREAAEKEVEGMESDLAAVVASAVRFTSKAIQSQRTEEAWTDTEASARRRRVRRSRPKD